MFESILSRLAVNRYIPNENVLCKCPSYRVGVDIWVNVMRYACVFVLSYCGLCVRIIHWQEVSTTEVRPLSKAPNPKLLPRRCNVGCPLLHLDGLNAENTFHSSLLCMIVYVTNKAHLSLICCICCKKEKSQLIFAIILNRKQLIAHSSSMWRKIIVMHNVRSGIKDFILSENKCMNVMHRTGLTFVWSVTAVMAVYEWRFRCCVSKCVSGCVLVYKTVWL